MILKEFGNKNNPVIISKLLHDTIKGSSLNVIEKSGHGEISLINTDRYIDLLKHFFENTTN
ncbi:hypothetical protein [Clostridium intestinale]|uniref:hypothetical protein n=1 Tax=Clostridium intestinale TaxID=36845 RepID=UPI002DD67BA2|nr:hypothetical protein [Clostridium intestinale]WRY53280.1 hypothetical protein P8F83_08750 [Clostridium intestinale]